MSSPESIPNVQVLRVRIRGMHCTACVGRVERTLVKLQGIEGAAVDLTDEAAVIWGPALPEMTDLVAALQKIGFDGDPAAEEEQAAEPPHSNQDGRRTVVAASLAAPVVLIEMGGHLVPAFRATLDQAVGPIVVTYLLLALATAIQAGPARHIYVEAANAWRRRSPDMSALVALGMASAYFYSAVLATTQSHAHELYFESSAVIAVFVLLGRQVERRVRRDASSAIQALLNLAPPTAIRLDGEAENEIPAAALKTDDLVRLRAGDRVPADLVITEGRVQADESMLTGEHLPVERTPGDPLTGGTIIRAGAADAAVTATGPATTLQKMVTTVRLARAQRPTTQRVVDRIAARFVPAVLVLALVSAASWLAAGQPAAAITHATAVLIIACPCALGLATPIAVAAAGARAARTGVILRTGDALEHLARCDAIITDKTGTLTTGELEAIRIAPVMGVPEDSVLRIANSLAHASTHPVARAIRTEASRRGLHAPPVSDAHEEIGDGIVGTVDGAPALLGRSSWLQRRDVSVENDDTEHVVAYVAHDGVYLGRIEFREALRAGVAQSVAHHVKRGCRVVLSTGDRLASAHNVADAVGISEVRAEQRPEDKLALVRAFQAEGARVAFVGDGVNDAPAIAAADVGVAVSEGADVAVESGDLVLVRSGFTGLTRAWTLAARTRRIIRQNLAWAFGYNVVLLPVAAGVLEPRFGITLTPMLAAAAMSLSSVAVVLNSARLTRTGS